MGGSWHCFTHIADLGRTNLLSCCSARNSRPHESSPTQGDVGASAGAAGLAGWEGASASKNVGGHPPIEIAASWQPQVIDSNDPSYLGKRVADSDPGFRISVCLEFWAF